MSAIAPKYDTDNGGEYSQRFKGLFHGVMKWEELDQLWETLNAQMDDQWFIYHVGDVPPEEAVSAPDAKKFIEKIDALLRQEHEEQYCGIVYVDDKQHPSFIKIFDPNNLGVSCGFSDNPPLPGWVMSKMQPEDLPAAFPPPKGRQRWWQKIFG